LLEFGQNEQYVDTAAVLTNTRSYVGNTAIEKSEQRKYSNPKERDRLA